MESLMAIVGSALADWANETLVPTGRIDADEVENFSLVEISLGALEVSHSQPLYMV